MIIVKSM